MNYYIPAGFTKGEKKKTFKIPKGYKKNTYAEKIERERKYYIERLKKTDDLEDFCYVYKSAVEKLEILIWLYEKKRVPMNQNPRNELDEIVLNSPNIIREFLMRKMKSIQDSKTHCHYEDLFDDFLDQALAADDFLLIANGETLEEIVHIKNQIEQNRTWRTNAFSLFDPLYVIDHMAGRDFEKLCAMLLKQNGFDDAVVTSGSGDHGVDVIATKGGMRFAIQCKCYSSNLGNSPVQEVYAGKSMYDCTVAAVMTNQYFTDGAKVLADRNDVFLWDRDEIKRLILTAAQKQPVPIVFSNEK